jgi:hypothetical protein
MAGPLMATLCLLPTVFKDDPVITDDLHSQVGNCTKCWRFAPGQGPSCAPIKLFAPAQQSSRIKPVQVRSWLEFQVKAFTDPAVLLFE